MSSRRPPLSVYTTKRRQRSISNPHSRPVPSSSPLKPLPHDADLTVEEMSRRMMKRSRSSLKRAHSGLDTMKSASVGASPADRPLEEIRPTKRNKLTVRVPLQTIAEPSYMHVDEEGTADMELTDILQLKTPIPRNPAESKQNESAKNEASDFLSPLPSSRLAKRVIAHRTSSSNLTENKTKKATSGNNKNLLMSPGSNDLASPFHSQPGSPNAIRSANKKVMYKKINRTRSVGTDLRRRATMRSFSRAVSPASSASSPGVRRNPSLPNSQDGQKENQDWHVPAQFKPSATQGTPRRPSDTSIPFVRESSFFDSMPEACSTPVHKKRTSIAIPPTPGRDNDATPRVPFTIRSSAFSQTTGQDFSGLDEPTPRARTTIASALLPTDDSLFPDSVTSLIESRSEAASMPPAQLNARRRMTIHMSQDSIFSSAMDFSTTVSAKHRSNSLPGISDKTRVEPDSVTLAPPSSPAMNAMSPTSSDGDELRDMFSILGLDEDEHWFMNSRSGTEASQNSGSSTAVNNRPKRARSTMSERASNPKPSIRPAKARVAGGPTPSPVSRAPGRRKRVLIVASSPIARDPVGRGKARTTVKTGRLDDPIQPATDSSDELNLFNWAASDSVNKIIPFETGTKTILPMCADMSGSINLLKTPNVQVASASLLEVDSTRKTAVEPSS